MSPNLLILNANVRTLDPGQPRARALVLSAGEIIYVGDDTGALAYRQHNSEVIDARGRLVLPAFADAHLHFCAWAQSLDRVNLEGCRSVQEAAARVAARIATARPGEVIYGLGWNHLDWQEPVFPDKRPLDAVAPLNPVILLRKDAHSAWVNSAALARFGLTRDTPDPESGRLERGPDGELTGLVRENALSLIGQGIGQSDEEISLDSLQRAIARAHRAGLTAVHSIEGANALRAWQKLHTRGQLRLRVIHALPDTMLDHALALGIQRRFGDEWLRLQAVKIFADGSLGSQTAEMFEPFLGSDKRGMSLTGPETMLELAGRAARGGLDVWTHAIGDAAIARTLTVYETLRAEGLDGIFRIEHVQHLRPADIPRLSAANVIASVQPIHQPGDRQMADRMLGPARARYTYAFNSLRQAGVTLALGSDCPVERIDPLLGIHAAVTRQDEQDEPPGGWYPEERLSVEEAVAGFTRGSAAASGDSERAGTLTSGKRADAIILSQDIFDVPPREILNTQVDYTVAGGEIVSSRQ